GIAEAAQARDASRGLAAEVVDVAIDRPRAIVLEEPPIARAGGGCGDPWPLRRVCRSSTTGRSRHLSLLTESMIESRARVGRPVRGGNTGEFRDASRCSRRPSGEDAPEQILFSRHERRRWRSTMSSLPGLPPERSGAG